jgi:hypothetical protein
MSEQEGLDTQAMAAEAKARGNALFAKKTDEGYKQALECYTEAIALVSCPSMRQSWSEQTQQITHRKLVQTSYPPHVLSVVSSNSTLLAACALGPGHHHHCQP